MNTRRVPPILAVLATILSLWASPARAHVQAKEEKDKKRIEVIAGGLKDAKQADAVSQRLAAFIMSGGYVSPELGKEKGLKEQIEAMVKVWVDKQVKTPEGTGGAAALAYVLECDDSKTKLLVEKLSPFTRKPEAVAANPGEPQPGPLGGTKDQEWVSRFLGKAVEHSKAILMAPPPLEIKQNVAMNDEPVTVAPGPRAGPVPKDIVPEADFTAESLYEDGAVVRTIYQTGDKVSRKISLKLVSRREVDDTIVNELNICDLTNAGDRFCQRKALPSNGGTETVPLDDRKPGMPEYTLTLTPQGEDLIIAFGRPKNVPGEEESKGAILTSLGKLKKKRSEQALRENAVVAMNGQNFYVLGQGTGGEGAWLFFRQKPDGGIDDTPETLAKIMDKGKGGWKYRKDKPDLGTIDGKPYHLEWNAASGTFEVKDGPGDKEKPKDPPAGDKDKEKGGGGDKAADNGQGPTGDASTPPAKDEENTFTSNDNVEYKLDRDRSSSKLLIYVPTEKGEAALKEDAKDYAKRYMIKAGGETDAKKKLLYMPAPFQPKNESKIYKPKDARVIRDKYLVTESDGGVLYYDASGFDIEKFNPNATIGRVQIGDKAKTISSLKGMELLNDAMKRADFTTEEITTALGNAGKVLTGKQAATFGGARRNPDGSQGHISVDFKDSSSAGSCVIWPKVNCDNPGGAGADKHKDVQKPNNPFETVGGGKFEPYSDKLPFGGEDLVRMDPKSDDAVLYANGVEKGKGTKDKPRKIYLAFAYKDEGQDKSTNILGPIFGEPKDAVGSAEPTAAISIGGLKDVTRDYKLTGLLKPEFCSGNKPEKGCVIVKATPATGAKDPAKNCLGPVVWWGMSKSDALALCQKE